jgi:N-acetylglucosaminyl-diphospho-decaprenol L-rhamnosyltransferase
MSRSVLGPPAEVSILIVSWNDWPKLQTCLRSILAAAVPKTEVMVIDNASRDGTPANVETHFPWVQLLRNPTNIGHTKAVNLGISRSRGRYILLLDSDTELLGDCYFLLHSFLEARPDVAVVAPRTFNTDGSVQETARSFPTPLAGLFGRQSTLTRMFPNNRFSGKYLRSDSLRSTEPFEVDQVGAAGIMFRRELFERYGPWDEGYFGYWVDTDWCRRLQQRGEHIFCLPAARLRHDEMNARGKRKSAHRIWLFHYGAWRYYTRWHTIGWWDPRSLTAAALLTLHGGLKLAANHMLRAGEEAPANPEPNREFGNTRP